MKKILLIGSPGSGKSTLAKKMKQKLGYPLFHLDVIAHIDNENRIPREELMQKVYEFDAENEKWMIDGNYTSTMDRRLAIADTVILLNLPTEIRVKNAIERTNQKHRDDIAPGFDNTIVDPVFIEYIKTYDEKILPLVYEKLNASKNIKNIFELKSYEEIDDFFENLKV